MAKRKQKPKIIDINNVTPLFGEAEVDFKDKMSTVKLKEDKNLKDPYKHPVHFLQILFTDPRTYKTIPPNIKTKHSFFVNQKIAILEPLRSVKFSQEGINPSAMMDIWHEYLYDKYKGRIPNEIWSSMKIKKNKEKFKYSDGALKLYLNNHQIGSIDILELIDKNPPEFQEEMMEHEHFLKHFYKKDK